MLKIHQEYFEKCKNEFYLDEFEIVRWKSNDSIPFNDMLEFFADEKVITEVQSHQSSIQREKETMASIKAYRKQMENHVHSEEELFEMRSAFGTGTTVVDVITGKKIKL